MKIVDDLLKEHAGLRRSLADLETLLGPGSDAGWDDCANCDMIQFQARLKELRAQLTSHETHEESVVAEVLGSMPDGREEFRLGLAKSRETLDDLMKLFSAASAVDHGRHVYSVRHIAIRIREELEAHLVYEERGLSPLLSGKSRAPSA
ncbi:MAG TPA: hypothetical protein DCZ01_09085 [Elusimicrobia bacterium]|nr:MAG: hypothetical protein A2X37_09115 [Elusimicrobia bacterium GWA2_66_18]OGR71582.1 MAG: hypothetical protein A2X40_05080 [Elusimicrobia bacterium GWC2_65_9]HAZ08654.1 hypothetical protein [Elusimicrobiota bacterium]